MKKFHFLFSFNIKNILAFTFMIIGIVSFSQSKKEQIRTLNNGIDSLSYIVNANRYEIDSLNKIVDANNYSIIEKNTIILNNENEIEKLNTIINQLNSEHSITQEILAIKDKELQTSINEISVLRSNLQNITDSITQINTNKKIDTLFWQLTDVTWNQMEFDLKLLIPTAQFESPINNILVSKDKKIKIFFEHNETFWSDEYEGNPLFYKVEDAIDYYSKRLNKVKIKNVYDGFVISGENSSNELIFVKGFYTDLSSMQGREYGTPMWLWSNTVVLKIVMNQADIADFDSICDLVNKGFTINSISQK
jgi:hypothetical protein